MNANALFNPTSINAFSENRRIVWSKFLKVLPQVYGNYDGFNYLGIGFMLVIFVGFIYWIIKMIKNKKEFVQFLKRNIFLLLACLFVLIFALSCNVNFGEKNLYVVEYFYNHLNIYLFLSMFRSSGRLFYSVYYLMLISGLTSLIKNSHKIKYILLISMLIIQIIDIFPALKYYHTIFLEKTVNYSDYSSTFWWNIPDEYTKLWVVNNECSYKLGYVATKNDLCSNIGFGNRRQEEQEQEIVTEKLAEVLREDLEDDAIYIFTKQVDYERFVTQPKNRAYDIFYIDGKMVLANFNIELRQSIGENDQIVNRATTKLDKEEK
jgi:hypothetical protein